MGSPDMGTPGFYGRESELNIVSRVLESVFEGSGSALVISGEAGIGKTSLIHHLMALAGEAGFTMLEGRARQGCTPMEPILQIFHEHRDELLEGIVKQVSIDTVFLISKSGLLISHFSTAEGNIDEDILSGMLTAVQDFVEDSFGDRTRAGGLGRLEYKDTKILIEHGEFLYIVAIIKGEEHEFMKRHLSSTLIGIERDFEGILKDWTGEVEGLEEVNERLASLTQRRYRVQRDISAEEVERERLRLLDRATTTARQMAKENPLLMVIEDLQWSDELSIQMIHYLARNLGGARALLVLSYRPEESPEALEGLITAMVEKELAERINLPQLSKEDISRMTGHFLGKATFSSDVLDQFYTNTKGNPLFALEYLAEIQERMVTTEGVIEELPVFATPPTLKDLITERLARLDENGLYLAEMLATIGTEVNERTIQLALDETRRQMLPDMAEQLIAKRVIERDSKALRFTNALFRQVLYEGLGNRWKPLMHLRAGEAYEEQFRDDTEPVLYELAGHYLKTNSIDKATKYALMAGDKAQAIFANDDALMFFTRALTIGKEHGSEMSLLAELGEKAANVHSVLGQYGEAEQLYNSALESYDDDRDRARVMWRLGIIWRSQGEYERAISQADDILRMDNDSIIGLLPKVYNLRGNLNYHRGKYDEAIADFTKAEGIVRAQNDLTERANMLSLLGRVHETLRDWDRALECYNDALSLAQEQGDLNLMALAYNGLGTTHKDAGRLKESIENLNMCREATQKIGDIWKLGAVHLNIGLTYYKLGEWDKAISNMETGLELQRRIGSKQGMANAYNNLGIIYDERGDWQKAMELHLESLELKGEMGDRYGMATSNFEIGLIAAKKGDVKGAEAHYLKCMALLDEIGNRKAKTHSLGALGDLCRSAGDIEEAIKYYEEMLAIAQESDQQYMMTSAHCGLSLALMSMDSDSAREHIEQAFKTSAGANDPYLKAETTRAKAMFDRETGSLTESIEGFDSAMKTFQELRAPFEIARIRLEKAIALAMSNDIQGAKESLEAASETFQRLNAKLEMDRVNNLSKELDQAD